jgi:hypothetical protein
MVYGQNLDFFCTALDLIETGQTTGQNGQGLS